MNLDLVGGHIPPSDIRIVDCRALSPGDDDEDNDEDEDDTAVRRQMEQLPNSAARIELHVVEYASDGDGDGFDIRRETVDHLGHNCYLTSPIHYRD